MTRFGWVAFVSFSIAASGCGTTTEVACTHGSDCPAGMVCIASQCTAATGCVTSRQCPGLVCDTMMGACVECVTAADCDAPLVCIDSVCGTAMPGIDSGVDAGMDAFIGFDAFVGPRDVGTGDATRDALNPRDTNIDADALALPDAMSFPDAYAPPDAFVGPDAYVIPDAFVPNDTSGCDPGHRFCGGTCVDTTTDPMNCSACDSVCPGGYACHSSACVCITRCSGVCTDLTADPSNCGACGRACGPGDYCAGSVCYRPACPDGETRCGTTCTDTLEDTNNCGGCGIVCPSGARFCSAGTCVPYCQPPLSQSFSRNGVCFDASADADECAGRSPCGDMDVCTVATTGSGATAQCMRACTPGLTQCNRDCVNTQLSVLDCGACGHACDPGEYCVGGVCGASCPSGQTRCGTTCTDTLEDTNNCGGCGIVCPSSSRFCSAGTCVPYCQPPLSQSFSRNGVCFDASADADECAGRSPCGDMDVCTVATTGSGATAQCMRACTPGLTQCNRDCVNTQLSVLDCGACGHACDPGEYCVGGVCGASCPSGQTRCGTTCTDTLEDTNNCGGCGIVCPSGARFCSAGTCVPYCQPPLSQSFSRNGVCFDASADADECAGRSPCGDMDVCTVATTGSGATAQCMRACTPGLTQCNRDCVNTQLSVLDCGACGHACDPGEYCVGGVCGASCPSGQTRCGTTCTDTLEDTNNCGGCGIVCPSGARFCSAGTCVPYCQPPLSQSFSRNGVCFDASADADECAGRSPCGDMDVCTVATTGSGATAQCMRACTPGLTQCNRDCVNTQLSVLSCGACGHACDPGEYCVGGVCGASCPSGQTRCGTTCTDTLEDTNNCGGCGIVCPSGARFCSAGTCVPYCQPPLSQSFSRNGVCFDASADADECAGRSPCGDMDVCTVATTGSGATAQCMRACTPGLTQCNRDCVNTQLSVLNCGSCGHACAWRDYCVEGVCVGPTPD